MIIAKKIGETEDVTVWKVIGTLPNGRPVDATLETEVDGRDAWWDEDEEPCETGGLVPGDEDGGWIEVLEALEAAA